MLDFKNGTLIKLRKVNENPSEILGILITGEHVIGSYQALRDSVVFTNKRILVINVQGVTGKKKDISSLPYSKIQAFSVETSGNFDLDSELEMYFSGLGKVKLEFTGRSDILQIGRIISELTL